MPLACGGHSPKVSAGPKIGPEVTTCVLTELTPDAGLAFGLCDLGVGEPELGYVSLKELDAARGPLGLPVERDIHFAPTGTIAAYAAEACRQGHIVT